MSPTIISDTNFADIMGVSKRTLENWKTKGKYTSHQDKDGKCYFYVKDLMKVPEVKEMIESKWEEEMNVVPLRPYSSIELFAGAGGLALGMSMAGFHHVMLNEIDHDACQTLMRNKPDWHVAEGDIHQIHFEAYRNHVDLLTGGFPCQAFSYAGNKGGFEDTRGTLFFELARAVKEISPKVFLCENVRGLSSHDNGRTLKTIRDTIAELGYSLVEPRVLQAIKFQVPQKRERLIMIAIRNDIADRVSYHWPSPYNRIMTLRDAFYAGELFKTDVPESDGQKYQEKNQKFATKF